MAKGKKYRVKKTTETTVPKKRLIIFSSAESHDLAQAIQSCLYTGKYSTEVWSNGFFKYSQSYISNFNFKDLKYNFDYAIVICSDDDLARVRGRSESKTRDNVILELGMCISTFGLKRVLIVKHQAVHLPSDLDGINPINYSIGVGESINAVAGTICAKIEAHIAENKLLHNKLSWDEYFVTMKDLCGRLSQSLSMDGYNYDVIVGINRGGVMAADLMSREKGHDVPVLALFAQRKPRATRFDAENLMINNADIVKMLSSNHINNILVVDSFTRDGVTILAAKRYLEEKLPGKTIRAAVIYANQRLARNEKISEKIDYIGAWKELDGKQLTLDMD